MLEYVPLEEGQQYSVFVYLDLYAAAVGFTSYAYADFYHRQPFTDQIMKKKVNPSGLWLYDYGVRFK